MKLCEVAKNHGANFADIVMHLRNFGITGTSRYAIESDKSITLKKDLTIEGPFPGMTELPIKFNDTDFDFALDGFSDLETLKNIPNRILKFSLTHCNNLKTFKYFPNDTKSVAFSHSSMKSLLDMNKYVTQPVSISLLSLKEIKNLKGCAKNSIGEFFLHNLANLTSLEGGPETVGKAYRIFGCHKLKSLKGCAKTVRSNFVLHNLVNLTSLKGGPEVVGKNYKISSCPNLTSLEGLPHQISGEFEMYGFHERGDPHVKDFLKLFDVRGISNIVIEHAPEVAEILNKWYPTQDIAKAQQELEKAGLGEYAEY